MRNLLNIAELFCYGVAVYVLFHGDGAGYWIMFSGGAHGESGVGVLEEEPEQENGDHGDGERI